MNFIDLFAGAGGLSEGFVQAGFRPVAHVECDEGACYTLKTRIAYHYLTKTKKINIYNQYLKGEITRAQLFSHLPGKLFRAVIHKEISDRNAPFIFDQVDGLLKGKSLDLLIGGPPCQSYSKSGRAADANGMKGDSRSYLYLQYGRFLKKYQPKLFVFENVPDLYTADRGRYYRNMMKYFRRIGYMVKDKVLNAADFGVLQRRERVFIIGWRKDVTFNYPIFKKVKSKWTVSDIFNDLPTLKPGEQYRWLPYASSEMNEYLTRFEIRNGVDFVTLNYARPHNERDLAIYQIAIERLANGQRLRYNEVKEEIRTQQNTKAFTDRFKVVDYNDVSHTMIAHIAKDGHHYIHPSLNQLRSITVREAARIQSFPDDYYFESIKEGENRTAAFKQIGNAVPPLMAGQIARKIYQAFNV